jgi:nucleoside-diphosphate-sugar epimerase
LGKDITHFWSNQFWVKNVQKLSHFFTDLSLEPKSVIDPDDESKQRNLKPPATRSMIDKYTEDIAVDGSLIQKELGFVPQYDLKTGWEETIQEMRRSGAL